MSHLWVLGFLQEFSTSLIFPGPFPLHTAHWLHDQSQGNNSERSPELLWKNWTKLLCSYSSLPTLTQQSTSHGGWVGLPPCANQASLQWTPGCLPRDSPQVEAWASKIISFSQCPPQRSHCVLSFWRTGSKSESSQSPPWARLLCSSRNSGRHSYPFVLEDVGKSTGKQSDTGDA